MIITQNRLHAINTFNGNILYQSLRKNSLKKCPTYSMCYIVSEQIPVCSTGECMNQASR